MVTIDLSSPPPQATGFLDGLPRRLALTLPELRYAAELAGGAPLPFDIADPDRGSAGGGLESRLGQSRASVEKAAYAVAVESLHAPDDTLRRRGLLVDADLDRGLRGAIGLLATPSLALDVDVATAEVQVKAWHRQAGPAVATLSTCDGVVFELAWFPVSQWAGELSRVAQLGDDVELHESDVPAHLDAPYHLVDAVGEAMRTNRTDLLPVLMDQHGDSVLGEQGEPVEDAAAAVAGVHSEGRGRLRVLAARVSDATTTDIGLVSWVLLADGWHSLTPHVTDDDPRITVRVAQPDDLATELAPVLAQVTA